MRTVLEVIQGTSAYFEKHGIENARLNIELLLAHVLGLKRIELYLAFDRPLGETELAPLRENVRRRVAGEPLQHLLGTVDFLGRIFQCDARALIPRPETEQLVEFVLARIQIPKDSTPLQIADIGTGSGVIACSLAAALPTARITAVDISQDALALARQNADSLGLSERIEFVQADLLTDTPGPFTHVVANLPYIATETITTLSLEVHHDPVLALDGGPDGLQLIARLVEQLPTRLAPEGLVALEVGHDQADRARELLLGAGCRSVEILADYQGINRFILGNMGNHG